MRILELRDVNTLLRTEIQKAGSVTAWAKNASIDRTYISAALHHRRPVSTHLLRALGLRKAVALIDRSRVLAGRDIRRFLRTKVAAAGGQTAWARETGLDRSDINKVMKGKRLPTNKMIDALGLRIVFVSKRDSAEP
jgi:DNA-binding phage protein